MMLPSQLGGRGLDRDRGSESGHMFVLRYRQDTGTSGDLGLHHDLHTDAAHVTNSHTRMGFLDGEGEHGSTVTEFGNWLVLGVQGASQNHARLVPLHFLSRHFAGKHVSVVVHDKIVGQHLRRTLNGTCVGSCKGMGTRRNRNELFPLKQRVCRTRFD